MSLQMSIQIQSCHLSSNQFQYWKVSFCWLLFRRVFFNERNFIAISDQIRCFPTSWNFFLLFFHLPDKERRKKNCEKAVRLTALVGWFLLGKFDLFNFYMVSCCSILFTDFGTLFVFAVGPLLPLSVIFFDYNGNFNEKMAKINKMAKNHFSRSDLGS